MGTGREPHPPAHRPAQRRPAAAPPGAGHVALVAAQGLAEQPVVRVHSECLTGDAFGSARCDCGPQLDAA
ncbi:hypothetical protein FA014_19365, partial [Cellulomonas hominis]